MTKEVTDTQKDTTDSYDIAIVVTTSIITIIMMYLVYDLSCRLVESGSSEAIISLAILLIVGGREAALKYLDRGIKENATDTTNSFILKVLTKPFF